MRGALVPYVPHIRPWVCVVALVFWLAAFSAVGIWGFIRRAID
jgi:ABC-2 type transport system permease protein